MMDSIVSGMHETGELKAIKKNALELEQKIKELEDEIWREETIYYESSYVHANASNCMKGWDGFLDAKLDGNDRNRQSKVPDEDRYFTNSSKKNLSVNSVAVPDDSNVPSRSITPENSGSSQPTKKRRKR